MLLSSPLGGSGPQTSFRMSGWVRGERPEQLECGFVTLLCPCAENSRPAGRQNPIPRLPRKAQRAFARFHLRSVARGGICFLVSSQGPGAGLVDFDVEVVGTGQVARPSAGWIPESLLQRQLTPPALVCRGGNTARPFKSAPCGFSLQECQVYYGLFPSPCRSPPLPVPLPSSGLSIDLVRPPAPG